MARMICIPCHLCKQCTNNLIFNWMKRRYSYRAGVFYYTVCMLMVIGIIVTLIFKSLMTSLNFFVNYACTDGNFNGVLLNFTIVMSIGGILCIGSFTMGRLTFMFSNYSLANFMSLGKWSDRLGCIVKWAPWLLSLVGLCWIVLSIINIFYIFINPNAWCATRWRSDGVVAVQNCRLYYKKYHEGHSVQASHWNAAVHSCNDESFLEIQHWYKLAADNLEDCTVDSINVYNAANLLIQGNGDQINWNDIMLSKCNGHLYPQYRIEDLKSKTNLSDLFRYISLYVIGWAAGSFLICIAYFSIRATTPFDAAFHQSSDEGEHWLIKIIRPLTPWSR